MLKATVELIPFGDFTRKSIIGELYITNDGSGTSKVGNYNYSISDIEFQGYLEKFKEGEYKQFPRKLGAWELVRRVLNKINNLKWK